VKRILVTGSRTWQDQSVLRRAIFKQVVSTLDRKVVIHGAADGADGMADRYAKMIGVEREPYPAEDFSSPLARNQHMVDLGADVCLAFATKWASGTGHCARRARKAGIPVIDYGVDTSMEAKP
jgi:hypothetical protein